MAPLPVKGRLLVAYYPANREGFALIIIFARNLVVVYNIGQNFTRDVEKFQKFVVVIEGFEVKKHCPRCVCDVRYETSSLGKPVNKVTVDGAHHKAVFL